MSSSLRWPDAALAGLASSMRTFASPAALAARGRIAGRPRVGVLLAAAGELGMDKSPKATARTAPPAVAGRVAAGAYAGFRIAQGPGAIAAGVAAGVGTFATWRARGLVVRATGLPDPAVAIGEDVIAVALAAAATRPDDPPLPTGGPAGDGAPSPDGAPSLNGGPADHGASPSDGGRSASLLRDGALGVLAGAVGTAVMTIAQGAEFALTDAEPSSAPADVADRLKRRAGAGRLKRRHRRAANQGMHWLYGTSWGLPYGIIAGSSSIAPEVSGPLFGLCVWAASLAYQPALGVADVPWKRSPASLGSEALFHVVYGIGAGATVRALRPAV